MQCVGHAECYRIYSDNTVKFLFMIFISGCLTIKKVSSAKFPLFFSPFVVGVSLKREIIVIFSLKIKATH